MKTQIVYLEPHDDLNSVRDKLNWTQASRVILVWPGRGRVLSRRFDLVMLQRYARNKGTRLGLVTLDPDVLHQAAQLQIPTFDSLEPQSEKAWRVRGARNVVKPVSAKEISSFQPVHRPARDSSTMSLAWRIAAFAVGFMAILILAALLVPQAEILVQPVTLDVNETRAIGLDIGSTNGIPSAAQIPAHRINVVMEGEMRAPTTGTTTQPDLHAHGEVTFTNLTNQSFAIPKGTTVRTLDANAPYFLTQSRAILDAEEGSQISVEVLASQPGPQGNVRADTIQSIDGPLGLSASVSNPAPMIGGSLESRRAVSPADQLLLQQQLEEDLLAQAHQTLLGMIQEGEDLIPGSIRKTKTIRDLFSDQVGEAADSLELSLVLEFEGIAYSPDELYTVLEQSLRQNLAPGENIQPNTLEILNIADFVHKADGDEAEILVTFSATEYKEADPSVVSRLVRGKPVDEAIEELNKERSIENVLGVEIRPSWLPRFPLLDLQIHVLHPWENDV